MTKQQGSTTALAQEFGGATREDLLEEQARLSELVNGHTRNAPEWAEHQLGAVKRQLAAMDAPVLQQQ